MTTSFRAMTLCALIITIAFVGCARRPSIITASVQPPPETPAASVATEPQEAVVEQREIVIAERSAPEMFAEDPHVKPIYFDFDRYEIRPDGAIILEADAAWLRANDVEVLVEGQCDERGTDEYNIALGDRRARAAKASLMAMGIAADRISTVSYGKERPVCTEHTEACWALNRRALVVVRARG